MGKNKNPFSVRPLQKSHYRHRVLLVVIATLMLFGGLRYAFAAILDPTASSFPNPNSPETRSFPSITPGSTSTPSAAPSGTNTVIPTFSGLNIDGPIFSERAGDSTSAQRPIDLYDQVNVWGDLNAISEIRNTNGDIVIDDGLSFPGDWGFFSSPASNVFQLNKGDPLEDGENFITLREMTGSATGNFSAGFHEIQGSTMVAGDDGSSWATLVVQNDQEPATLRLQTNCGSAICPAPNGLGWEISAGQVGLNPASAAVQDLFISNNAGGRLQIPYNGGLGLIGSIFDITDEMVTIGDSLTVMGANDAPFTISRTSGEVDIQLSSGPNVWEIGTGRSTVGAPNLYFYAPVSGTLTRRAILESDGDLVLVKDITAVDGVFSDDVTAVGSVTGSSIGSFYMVTGTASTAVTNGGVTAPTASCTAGDLIISCSGGFSGTPLYVRITGSTLSTSTSPQGCSVRGYVESAPTPYAIRAYAMCFSPNG